MAAAQRRGQLLRAVCAVGRPSAQAVQLLEGTGSCVCQVMLGCAVVSADQLQTIIHCPGNCPHQGASDTIPP